jgi:hypothetical protein
MSAAAASAPLDDIAVFRAKCIDAAERYATDKVPLLDAVDALHNYAVAYGLDQALGQDAVQQIISDAFRRLR